MDQPGRAWATAAIVAASLAVVAAIVGGVGAILPEAPDASLFVAGGIAPAAVGVALAAIARVSRLMGARGAGVLVVAAVVAGAFGGLAAIALRESFQGSENGSPAARGDVPALAAVGIVALAVFLAAPGCRLLHRAGLPAWASAILGVIGGAVIAPFVGVIAAVVHLLTAVAAVALIGCAAEMRRRMPVPAVPA